MTTDNTNQYRPTPEEETCDKLLEEAKETLSGPALYIVEGIRKVAYEVWLVRNPAIDPEEADLAKQSWRFSATKFTPKDFESLINIMRAAEAAADSINPDDPTPIGYKVFRGHVHSYYGWIAGPLEEILDEAFESKGYKINQ